MKTKTENTTNELSGWFSTYGLITAQRIYDRYGIHLSQDDLIHTLKTPGTFYHRLLIVPLGNVFNGIVLEQATDYQKYAQKQFIDYLLSDENAKSPDSPGANIREDLEAMRLELMERNNAFHRLEIEHEKLIAASQTRIIEYTRKCHEKITQLAQDMKRKLSLHASEAKVFKALQTGLVYSAAGATPEETGHSLARMEAVLEEPLLSSTRETLLQDINQLQTFFAESADVLEPFHADVKAMEKRLRSTRSDFHAFILRANELFILLPEYRPDPGQVQANREALHFDTNIGE